MKTPTVIIAIALFVACIVPASAQPLNPVERRALKEYRIAGLKTSIPFHMALMDSPRFQWGQFDTRFLESHTAPPLAAAQEHERLAAIVAAMLHHERGLRNIAISHGVEGEQGQSTWRRSALLTGMRALL